jgi:foldase protein PrsA
MPKPKFKFSHLLVLVLLLFSACQAWEDRQTVATVNGEAIKKKPYRLIYQARYRGLIQAHSQNPSGMEQKLAQEVIGQMVEDVLYFQEAQKRNLVPSPEEVGKSTGHMQEGKTPAPALVKALAEKGITMEELAEEMRRRGAINALQRELTKDVATTEKEAQEYYRKNKQLFYIPPQFQIALLYAQNPEQARGYGEQLKAGKVRFEDLVLKNPPHISQMMGAQPAWVFAEDFSSEMGDVIMQTKAGQISGPARWMEGYYLVKIYAKKDQRLQNFSAVKNKIIRNLNKEKQAALLARWLAEQKQKAKIEIKKSRLAVKVELKIPPPAMPTAGSPPPPAGGDKR